MAIIYTYPIKTTSASRNDLILISDSEDKNKTKQISVAKLPGGIDFVGVGGNGTAGKIPKWSTQYDLTDSSISEDSANGNVGIKTSTPLATLDVAGSIRLTGTSIFNSTGSGTVMTLFDDTVGRNNRILLGANASGAFVNSTYSSGGTQNLILNSSGGNVGIGTTIPNAELDVQGVNVPLIRLTETATGGKNFLIGVDTNNSFLRSSGNLLFQAGPSYNGISILESGNVGIGTTNPVYKLEVSSNVANGGGQLAIVNTSQDATAVPTKRAEIIYRTADTVGTIKDSAYIRVTPDNLNNTTGSSYAIWTRKGNASPTESMRINNTGNVGIGTISPAADGLEVANRAAVSGGNTQLFITGNTSGRSVLGLGDDFNNIVQHVISDHTQNSISFHTAATSVTNNERMRITSLGNVGIGTTNPNDGDLTIGTPKLHVAVAGTAGTFNLAARFQSTTTDADNTGTSILINSSNDRGLLIKAGRKDGDRQVAYFNVVSSVGVETNMLTMGRFDDVYNVGIGTTTPTSKLAVDGGDIEVDDSASGLILRSPNGVRHRVKVANDGTLTATTV